METLCKHNCNSPSSDGILLWSTNKCTQEKYFWITTYKNTHFIENQLGEILRRVQSHSIVKSMYLFRFIQIDEEAPLLCPRHLWQLQKAWATERMKNEIPCSKLPSTVLCLRPYSTRKLRENMLLSFPFSPGSFPKNLNAGPHDVYNIAVWLFHYWDFLCPR